MSNPVEAIRRQHESAVLANQVQPASLWGQPCRAYHVCVRPSPAAAAELAVLQADALRLETALLALRCCDGLLSRSSRWTSMSASCSSSKNASIHALTTRS